MTRSTRTGLLLLMTAGAMLGVACGDRTDSNDFKTKSTSSHVGSASDPMNSTTSTMGTMGSDADGSTGVTPGNTTGGAGSGGAEMTPDGMGKTRNGETTSTTGGTSTGSM